MTQYTSITTLSNYEPLALIFCPQYAQVPVQLSRTYWISRRVLGRVHPEVFFTAQGFQREEGVREHDHRYVTMPALPVATLIMIQAEFFFDSSSTFCRQVPPVAR